MLSALGKLLKFFIILIALVIGITYFTGTEVSFSDNQDSTSETQKTTETNLSSALNCDTGYYKNSTKTKCLKVPDNAVKYEGADAWYCKSGFIKSGDECIEKVPEETIKQFVTIDSAAKDAPMRVQPGGTVTLRRVPEKTKLEVMSKKIIKGATKYMPDVTWFQVNYNGATGWVSEFVTTSATL